MPLQTLGTDLTRCLKDFAGEVQLLDSEGNVVREINGFVEVEDVVAGNIYGLGGHEGGVVNNNEQPVFACDEPIDVGARIRWDGRDWEISRRESINKLFRHMLYEHDPEAE